GAEQGRCCRLFARRTRLQEIGEVVAGAEALARAVEQHGAHLGGGIRGSERLAELPIHLRGKCVFLFRAIERDARNAVSRRYSYMLSPYQACSLSSAGAA